MTFKYSKLYKRGNFPCFSPIPNAIKPLDLPLSNRPIKMRFKQNRIQSANFRFDFLHSTCQNLLTSKNVEWENVFIILIFATVSC